MIKLRTQITRLLKTIHPKVYFNDAPDDAQYPYVVYSFLPSFTNEEQEIFPMDIDLWDMQLNGDTARIEELSGTIWKKLNNRIYIDKDIYFSIYQDSRYPLTDDDPRILRRKLTFEVRYFNRRLNYE